MNGMISYSPTLVVRKTPSGARIACRACGHDIADAAEVWKEHAILDERPLGEAGGAMFKTEGNVLLRRFYCPGCATTLDTETALPGEPFLIDRVAVR